MKKKEFSPTDCIIRLARPEDAPDLLAIAKTIWDGHDYLPTIIQRWTKERWFFVAEYMGKVIACIKLSEFPDNVIWIEGLRVHARYQGKGIGAFMNAFVMDYCQRLTDRNLKLTFEFCTYYQNLESLKLSDKMGARLVESYYNLERRGVAKITVPEILKDYGMDIFELYPSYIPLGWQSVHNHPDSLAFIRKYATVFRSPQALYLCGGVGERCITLLSEPPEDLLAELPYLQGFFGSRKRISIIVPRSLESRLPQLMAAGFDFWDDEKQVVANMLIKKLPF